MRSYISCAALNLQSGHDGTKKTALGPTQICSHLRVESGAPADGARGAKNSPYPVIPSTPLARARSRAGALIGLPMGISHELLIEDNIREWLGACRI